MAIEKTSKAQIEQVFAKDDVSYRISLLEKHLVESREEFNKLKEEELELRERQTEIIGRLEEDINTSKKVDEILAKSISDKVDSIKTEMFDEWQTSIKDSVVQSVAALTEEKLAEYNRIYEAQNRVIEAQQKKFQQVILTTRIMRFMCYAICFVSALVMLFLPIGEYLFNDIKVFLEEPSVWGGIVLFAAVLLMILALALAILLRRKPPKD